jgi:mannose-6-phosphate isomerase-like protein (cupin superfamily)
MPDGSRAPRAFVDLDQGTSAMDHCGLARHLCPFRAGTLVDRHQPCLVVGLVDYFRRQHHLFRQRLLLEVTHRCRTAVQPILDIAGSRHIDYRISMYQPMAHVVRHKHGVQEQIYHVLEGEGLMEIAGKNHVVRKHDFIFLPPGVEHAISNSGLVDLVFLVITSPVTDDEKPV